jgi:predicted transcriptional regulator
MSRRRGPTDRQREIAEALERNGGSQTRTANELGITRGAVRTAMIAYRRWTEGPEPAPTPPSYLSARQIVVELRERLERLEGTVSDLVETNERLIDVVSSLLHRQPLILEVRASHRRKADGGGSARRESRERARELEELVG